MIDLNSFNPLAPSVKQTTTISSLRVYPIKSCRGISVPTTTLTRRGLDLDRNWMFIDTSASNKFVTIRDISTLTLIDTALEPASAAKSDTKDNDDVNLVISIRDNPTARVSIPARPTKSWLEANCTLQEVDIWSAKTDAWLYAEEINSIFATHIGKPIALVYKGPTPRTLRGNGAEEVLGRKESTNFPDVLPLLIASEASLSELNTRLEKKGADRISIERFRPNIIVSGEGLEAWNEDDWRVVRILNSPSSSSSTSTSSSGAAGFLGGLVSSGPPHIDIDVMAHCARCQVPNVNPDTAEKDKHEPWDTLVAYRRIDEGIKWKPCFGMLSCPRGEGEVKVGMKLQVLETTRNHLYKVGF